MVFSCASKRLDLGNLKATAYKHNKEIFLPKNVKPDLELAHETHRCELSRVFNRVVSNSKPGSNGPKAPMGSESNLTPEQLAGLKSLKKRV